MDSQRTAGAVRTILGEIGNTTTLNSPKKRKYAAITSEKHLCLDGNDGKKSRVGKGDEENQAAHTTTKTPTKGRGSGLDLHDIVTSQETLADNPESQDTIPDPDLPSSSSDKVPPEQLTTPPRSQIEDRHDTKRTGHSNSAKVMASNLKCRLGLAMYKLRCHKEELSYKRLLPRQEPRLVVGSGASPASQPPPERPLLTASLKTPKAMTSNVSNERSIPRLMHRSSSGDASISETPVRRNYKMGLSSPPDSHETLPRYMGMRLPDIRGGDDREAGRSCKLPSINNLEHFAKPE